MYMIGQNDIPGNPAIFFIQIIKPFINRIIGIGNAE